MGLENFNVKGKFCVVDYFGFKELKSKAVEVRDYFDDNYKNVIEILKPDYPFYNYVNIRFTRVKNPGYYQGKIEVCPETHLTDNNMGCLIHEGTHAVQNYPGEIGKFHLCCAWMEGIADYCRHFIGQDNPPIKGNPLNGYREAAHFLLWLRKKYNREILQKINRFIHDYAHKISCQDTIFTKTVGRSYRELLSEYLVENK